MALRKPSRLPKSLNRRAGPFAHMLVRKYYGGSVRAKRRRHERSIRVTRRMGRISTLILSEFRVWVAIGVTVTIATTAAVLLLSPFFDVRKISVRRQDPRIDLEDIQQTLSPLFRQRLLLVTKGQVTAMLEAEYPDIERVEITKDYPSDLSVSIYLEPVVAAVTIEDSAASATQSGAVVATGSGTYAYITKSGQFVQSPIRLDPGRPIDTLHLTDWGIRPQNRTRVLSPEMLKSIFAARDTLRTDFGLVIKDITVHLRAEEFHIRTNKVTLWFDLTSPLAIQFQRFREFLRTGSLDQVKEYIDLRIADKIIYK